MRAARKTLGNLPVLAGLAAAGLLVCLLAAPAVTVAQGCAMCKAAIGGPEDPMAAGFNVSILFLMSMPFVLLGSVGAWFAYMYRRQRRRKPTLRVLRTPREETL